MIDTFNNIRKAINHLEVIHKVFKTSNSFGRNEKLDFHIYKHNHRLMLKALAKCKLPDQLYSQKGRQMILADLLEYIFLGRGYYGIRQNSIEDREYFVKVVLHFVNMLMTYEAMTVSDRLRRKVINKLGKRIPEIRAERYYANLASFVGKVGLPERKSDAPRHLNRYFDSLLPKTAGGLWHELLVYVFLLRNNIGHIIPLLLSQRFLSKESHIIPPDFFVITSDKNLYGIEVGTKKEIQSGSFSMQTKIPTATLDTENSRVSDRCPICNKWIPFCDFVIDTYSDFSIPIQSAEVRCLDLCNKYSANQIAAGNCPYTKYSRTKARTLDFANHQYADRLHYHYQCVLSNVPNSVKDAIIQASDNIALKTHYPYYSGLEGLESK